MKLEGTSARPSLYPDLSQFYTQGGGDSPSSSSLPPPPPPPPRRQQPSAPPPHLLPESVPEEPEEDYMLDDLSLSQDAVDNLPENSHRSATNYPHHDPRLPDLTVDYTLDNCSLDRLLELEPDYDMDDLQQDTLNNLNLTASEKKILHTKNIEVPEPPRNDKDFRAWMTWRLQANKLLAAVILMRKGHHVHLRHSEIRRKPLTRQNVEKVVQQARVAEQGRGRRRGSAERTSLPACPYVMYGIPRVNLPMTPQP